MVVLTIATSQSRPNFKNRIKIEYDDLYVYIKIKTKLDPNFYKVEDGTIKIFFENKREYQILQNYLDDKGNNLSRSIISYEFVNLGKAAIAEYDKEPLILSEGNFVFENFVEDDKFVIKIKKEIIMYDNIIIENVNLVYENFNDKIKSRSEGYY
jgi:hypothetical protein